MSAVLELNHIADDILARSDDLDQALRVDHTSKFFGGPSRFTRPGKAPKKQVAAVHDVTIHVKRREIYGVLGGNGSGKSTLIRLISTLLLPDEGAIDVFGYDVVNESAKVRRLLNRVSVEASLFKKLSPMENLLYAARLYSVNATVARREITRILEALGIPKDRITQPVEKISRGMQQKVSIARALLTSPVLLLLDEPTTGLDPRSKKDVERFVLQLRDEHDATVLLTSHDMEEADALCDRLAILARGKIVLEGTPKALKDEYAQRHRVANPTLEDVFMEATGHGLEDDDREEGADG